MAQLPPDGTWLIQQIGNSVTVFHRHTEEEIVTFDPFDVDDIVRALRTIYQSETLTEEQKYFAHFWSGYFYAHARNGNNNG